MARAWIALNRLLVRSAFGRVIRQRYPDDKDFLNEVLPKLVLWHDWWPKYRDAKHDGLLEWGSANGDFQDAQYETGWDDNMHYATAIIRGDDYGLLFD